MPSAKRASITSPDKESPPSKRNRHETRKDSAKESRKEPKSQPKEHRRESRDDERRKVKEAEHRSDHREAKRGSKEPEVSKEAPRETRRSKDSSNESRRDNKDSKRDREPKKSLPKDAEDTAELIGPMAPVRDNNNPTTETKEHKKLSTSAKTGSKDEKVVSEPSSSKNTSDAKKRHIDAVTTSKETAESSKNSPGKIDEAKRPRKETHSASIGETKAPVDASKVSKPVDSTKINKTDGEPKKAIVPISSSATDTKKDANESSSSKRTTAERPRITSTGISSVKRLAEGSQSIKTTVPSKRAPIEGPKQAVTDTRKNLDSVSSANRSQTATASKPQIPPVKAQNVQLNKPIIEHRRPAAMEHIKTIEEFYAADDQAAKRFGPEKLLASFIDNLNSLRSMITQSLARKDEIPLSFLCVVANMRRSMRLMMFHNSQVKEGVASALKAVEQKLLGFQNVKSEILHVKKDIARCLEFRSADEDIELDTVVDFFEKAPESLSKAENIKDDEHELHLARLNWEMQQRVDLSETLAELEGRRDVLFSAIRGKEKRLKSMKSEMKNVTKAMKPMQEICGNWPGIKKEIDSQSPQPEDNGNPVAED